MLVYFSTWCHIKCFQNCFSLPQTIFSRNRYQNITHFRIVSLRRTPLPPKADRTHWMRRPWGRSDSKSSSPHTARFLGSLLASTACDRPASSSHWWPQSSRHAPAFPSSCPRPPLRVVCSWSIRWMRNPRTFCWSRTCGPPRRPTPAPRRHSRRLLWGSCRRCPTTCGSRCGTAGWGAPEARCPAGCRPPRLLCDLGTRRFDRDYD